MARWSSRGADGRFTSRAATVSPTFSAERKRKGVSGPVHPGARPLPNRHVGESFIVHLYSSSVLSKRDAWRLFKARGGRRYVFTAKWAQLKRSEIANTDRRISRLGAHQVAEQMGMPFQNYWRLHMAGLRRYWLRKVTDAEFIEEWYGTGSATQVESDSLPAPKGA